MLKDLEKESIQVTIRVRPQSDKQLFEDNRTCIKHDTSSQRLTLLNGNQSKSFAFDSIVGIQEGQEDIFEKVGLNSTAHCLEGYNCSIFAYGQTGSGKTFTMMGVGQEDPSAFLKRGLIPRTLQHIFQCIQKQTEQSRTQYLVKCTFLQIYNEAIIDLLDKNNSNLQIRQDLKKGVYVQGILQETISKSDEALELLRRGSKGRHVGSTYYNETSSRSHSVFTLLLQSKFTKNGVVNVKIRRFHFIDLAGSERTRHSNGQRLKQGCSINKSLHVLGMVINSLVEATEGKPKHVNYRDSKLTFLLKDALGGNSKTHLIANISPSFAAYSETLSTLNFARRVKLIKLNKASINQDASGNLEALKCEILRLKQQIIVLRSHSSYPTSITTKQINDSPVANELERVFLKSDSNLSLQKLLKDYIEESIQKETKFQVELLKREQKISKLYETIKQYTQNQMHMRMIIQLYQKRFQRMKAIEAKIQAMGGDNIQTQNLVQFFQQEREALNIQVTQLRELLKETPFLKALIKQNNILKQDIRNPEQLSTLINANMKFLNQLKNELSYSIKQREELNNIIENYAIQKTNDEMVSPKKQKQLEVQLEQKQKQLEQKAEQMSLEIAFLKSSVEQNEILLQESVERQIKLEDNVKELQTQIEVLKQKEQKINDLEATIRQKQQKQQEFEQKNNTLTIQIVSLKQQMNDKQTQLSTLKQSIVHLEAHKTKMQQTITNLSEQHTIKINDFQNQISEKDQQISSIKILLQQMQNTLDNERQNHESLIKQKSNEILSLLERINNLETQHNQQISISNDLKQKIEEQSLNASKLIQQLNSKVQDLTKQLQFSNKQIIVKQEQTQQLQTNWISEKQNLQKSTNSKIQQLSNQLKSNQTQYNQIKIQYQSKINALENKISQIENTNEELSNKLSVEIKRIQELNLNIQTQKQNFEKQLSEVSSEKQRLRTQFEDLQNIYTILEKSKQQSDKSNLQIQNQLQKEKIELQSNLDEIQNKYIQNQVQIKEYIQNIQKLNLNISNLESKLQEIQKQSILTQQKLQEQLIQTKQQLQTHKQSTVSQLRIVQQNQLKAAQQNNAQINRIKEELQQNNNKFVLERNQFEEKQKQLQDVIQKMSNEIVELKSNLQNNKVTFEVQVQNNIKVKQELEKRIIDIQQQSNKSEQRNCQLNNELQNQKEKYQKQLQEQRQRNNKIEIEFEQIQTILSQMQRSKQQTYESNVQIQQEFEKTSSQLKQNLDQYKNKYLQTQIQLKETVATIQQLKLNFNNLESKLVSNQKEANCTQNRLIQELNFVKKLLQNQKQLTLTKIKLSEQTESNIIQEKQHEITKITKHFQQQLQINKNKFEIQKQELQNQFEQNKKQLLQNIEAKNQQIVILRFNIEQDKTKIQQSILRQTIIKEQLEKRISELEEQRKKIENQNFELDSKIQSQKQKYEKELYDVQQRNKKIEGQFQGIQSILSEMQRSKEQTYQSNTQIQQQFEKTSSQLKQNLDQYKNKYFSTQAKLKESFETIERFKTNLSNLEKKLQLNLNESTLTHNKLQTQLIVAKQQLQNQKEAVIAKLKLAQQTQLKITEQKHSQINRIRDHFMEQLEEYKNKVAQQRVSLNDKITDLSEINKETQDQIYKLNNTIRKLEDQILNQNQKTINLKRLIENFEKQKQQYTKQIEQKEVAYKRLLAKICNDDQTRKVSEDKKKMIQTNELLEKSRIQLLEYKKSADQSIKENRKLKLQMQAKEQHYINIQQKAQQYAKIQDAKVQDIQKSHMKLQNEYNLVVQQLDDLRDSALQIQKLKQQVIIHRKQKQRNDKRMQDLELTIKSLSDEVEKSKRNEDRTTFSRGGYDEKMILINKLKQQNSLIKRQKLTLTQQMTRIKRQNQILLDKLSQQSEQKLRLKQIQEKQRKTLRESSLHDTSQIDIASKIELERKAAQVRYLQQGYADLCGILGIKRVESRNKGDSTLSMIKNVVQQLTQEVGALRYALKQRQKQIQNKNLKMQIVNRQYNHLKARDYRKGTGHDYQIKSAVEQTNKMAGHQQNSFDIMKNRALQLKEQSKLKKDRL